MGLPDAYVVTTPEYKEAFDKNVDTFKAIDSAEVVEPTEPVDEYTQRAINLSKWAQDDDEQLGAAGLDASLIPFIIVLAYALRYSQAIWDSVRFTSSEAARRMAELTDQGRDIAARLFHALTYALQDDPSKLRHVRALRQGGSKNDLVQDLASLGMMCERYFDDVSRIGVTIEDAKEAGAVSTELSNLIANAYKDSGASNKAKDMRDRAFTLLKKNVDKVRACGQFVFWRTPSRLSGYTDSYSPRRRGSEEEQMVQMGGAM